MRYEKELAVASAAVQLGGKKALEMRPTIAASEIIGKGGDPRDVLTKADPAVQEVVVRVLRSNFPEDTFLGEEEERVELEQKSTARRVWVIDPIDGTTNYTRTTSTKWGVTVALIEDGLPVVGTIFLPAHDGTLICAARCRGCYLNLRRMRAEGHVPLNKAVLGLELYFLGQERARQLQALADAARGSHVNLSAVYSIYELVQGEIDAYVNIHIPERGACVWDFAAGHLFLREMVPEELQSSVAFFPDGTPLSYHGRVSMEAVLTPYPELAQEILKFLTL